jgi:hypothetical protein
MGSRSLIGYCIKWHLVSKKQSTAVAGARTKNFGYYCFTRHNTRKKILLGAIYIFVQKYVNVEKLNFFRVTKMVNAP